MGKHRSWIIVLALLLLLTGCQEDTASLIDEEPTATYDWMAGESPVSNRRIGLVRAGVCLDDHAVSPTGVYFAPGVFVDHGTYSTLSEDSYIWYVDHGSDTLVKLCGRVDCTHDNPDCNAYLYKGSDLSYYQGKLYAVIGEGYPSEECKLIRMNPDGSGHFELLDIMSFVESQGGAFACCRIITDGYCVLELYHWQENGDGTRDSYIEGVYFYKLDGSMQEPERLEKSGTILYHCGDMLVTLVRETVSGEKRSNYYKIDLATGEKAFLMESPGVTAWFGEQEAYYFKDGHIMRQSYATGEVTSMVDTGLEGSYYAFCFRDCLVVASEDESDDQLYFYNWAFELVDTVKLNYPIISRFAVSAETAERIILTSEIDKGTPLYYIDKAELGSGNVQLHEFKYSEK